MIKLNKLTTCFIYVILIIIFIYLLLTPYNFRYLFNSILGRTILFIMIIFFITMNQILGIIISAIVLFFYNEYIIDKYSYTGNNMKLESFTNYNNNPEPDSKSDLNDNHNMNIIDNKISLEHNLRPKWSNQQLIHKTNIKKYNEPNAFEKIMTIFPYF